MKKEITKCRKCDKPSTHKKAKLCAAHFKEHTKARVAKNAKTWMDRIKKGTVKPKFFYDGKPTVAAIKAPAKALASFTKLDDAKERERREKALKAALAKAEEKAKAEKAKKAA